MALFAIGTKQQKVTVCLCRLHGGAPEGRHVSLDPVHHGPRAAAGAATGRSGARLALPVPGDGPKCSRPTLGPRRAVSDANCSACLPPGNYGATVQPGAARRGGSRKRKGNLLVACRHFVCLSVCLSVCLYVTSRNWRLLIGCASRRWLRNDIGQIKYSDTSANEDNSFRNHIR